MDRPSRLVLDDLYEREPDVLLELGRRRVQQARQSPEGVDSRSAPQLREEAVEHDVLVVAVALRADGLAQQSIVAVVMRKTGELGPVRAVLRRRGRMARPGSRLGPRVHGSEGRSCQRREDHRVGGDRLRHSLPAGEACHDEVAGVVAIDVRARRATGLAPVAARLEDETLVSTVVGDLSRGGVEVVLVPKEAERVRAVVGLA